MQRLPEKGPGPLRASRSGRHKHDRSSFQHLARPAGGSCATASITCLDIIIDQAGSDAPLLPSVLSVEPSLPWYSLFTGLPEAGAEDLAPLLVRVDLAQPLQRHWLIGLMHELDGRSQLLALASLWPFQALAEHLGRCLEARNGGCLGLLRYYDPRLFPLLFSHVLQPDQQQPWLRPAVFWSWLDRDGVPQRLLGPRYARERSTTSAPSNSATASWTPSAVPATPPWR